MRLFVALTLPDDVVDDLRAGTVALREMAPQLRWTPPQQWHLTLAFLGEVDESALEQLTSRLTRAAGRHPAPALSLGGGGRFGQRVLWTRVHGDRHGLRRLAESARAAARRSGVPTEQRPYRPHLTLARAGDGTDLRPLVERLAGYEGRGWVADRLHLVRSRLGAGPGGYALHEPIAGWPLGG